MDDRFDCSRPDPIVLVATGGRLGGFHQLALTEDARPLATVAPGCDANKAAVGRRWLGGTPRDLRQSDYTKPSERGRKEGILTVPVALAQSPSLGGRHDKYFSRHSLHGAGWTVRDSSSILRRIHTEQEPVGRVFPRPSEKSSVPGCGSSLCDPTTWVSITKAGKKPVGLCWFYFTAESLWHHPQKSFNPRSCYPGTVFVFGVAWVCVGGSSMRECPHQRGTVIFLLKYSSVVCRCCSCLGLEHA